MAANNAPPKLAHAIDNRGDEKYYKQQNGGSSIQSKSGGICRSDGNNYNNKNSYMYGGECEDNTMLTDLSGARPQLAPMFVFGDTINTAKSRKRNLKKQRNKLRKFYSFSLNSTEAEEGQEGGRNRKEINRLSDTPVSETSNAVQEDGNGGVNGKYITSGVENRDNYTGRSKIGEYNILTGMRDFPQLAPMFGFEAGMGKKSRKSKKRNKIDKAGNVDAAVFGERSGVLSADGILQRLHDASDSNKTAAQLTGSLNSESSKERQENQSGARYSKGIRSNGDINRLIEAPTVDFSKGVQEDENGSRNRNVVSSGGGVNGDKYIYNIKAEEYNILADMSEFTQLAAMFALGAGRKSRKKTKRKKEEVEVVLPTPNVSGRARGAVETTEKINAENDIRSSLVIDGGLPCPEGAKGNERKVGSTNLIGFAETEQAEAIAMEEQKIFEERDDDNLGKACKPVESTEEINVETRVGSSLVIAGGFPFQEGSEGHEGNVSVENLIGLPKIEQKEAVAREEQPISEEQNDDYLRKACKAVEATEEINVYNDIRSSSVIDRELSFVEGLGNLIELAEIEKKEARVREEKKIFRERDDINIAVEVRKQLDSAKDTVTLRPLNTESERQQNFVLHKRLRTPRYFNLPVSSGQMCYSGGRDDHDAVEHIMEKKKKPCYICGGLKHIPKHCKKGHVCFRCKGMGHLARDCLEKDQSSNEAADICLRCGDSGHDMFSCYNEYSADDLKKIQCYVCKEFGHLCCVDFINEGRTVVTCYKCGQNGHLGSGCKDLLRDTNDTRADSFRKKCKVEGHFARQCNMSRWNKLDRGSTTFDRSFKRKEGAPYFRYAPCKVYKPKESETLLLV